MFYPILLRISSYLLALGLLLLASSVLLTGCHETPAAAVRPPPEVTTRILEPRTIPAVFEYVGFTKSSHLVQIRARVEGYLNEIAYTEGDLVQKDELLFQLDPKPFIASLEAAKGALARQEAVLWRAQQALKRFKPLYEQHAASLRDLENAMASQQSAEADVMTAKANVYQADLNLGYTTIKSPITGLSAQSNYREGALITPGGSQGLLTTISAIDPMWAIFSVAESDLLKYRIEADKKHLILPQDMNFDVQLVLSDGSTFPSLGKVNFASPSLDPSTGTMTVRAIVPNPQNLLKPGQFVRARLLGAERPDSLLVPQSAVLQGSKGMFVYIVDADGKVALRHVDVGSWYGDDWIITGGLTAGEQVIITGINKVQVGAPVKILPAQSPEPPAAPVEKQAMPPLKS